MTSCPSCGKENPVGRPRCADCGAKIPPAAQEPNGGPAQDGAAEDRSAQPFQALGTVGLKRVRLDEAALPGPGPLQSPETGRKKSLPLPEIRPVGGAEDDEEDLPVRAAADLPARSTSQERSGVTELSDEVLEELVDYASDGVLGTMGGPAGAPGPADGAPRAPAAATEVDLPAGPINVAEDLVQRSASRPAPAASPPLPPAKLPGASSADSIELAEDDDAPPLELDRPEPAAAPVAARLPEPAAAPEPARPRPVPEFGVEKRPGPRLAAAPVESPFAGGSVVVGTPPVPPAPELPEVIRAIPAKLPGLLSRIGYGLQAPRVARHQREVLGHLNAHLSRLRRQEVDYVAAFGRAARKHGLVPESAKGLVVAAEREEARPQGQAPAGAVAPELAGLEERHGSMAARLKDAQKRLIAARERVEQLASREQELSRPPPRSAAPQVAAARQREAESVRAERQRAELELRSFQEQADAAEKPLRRLEEEMIRAKADANRGAPATRAVIEIDEQIGRALLDERRLPQSLAGPARSVETCRGRLRDWEKVLREQQSELEAFDGGRARSGFWVLVLGTFGLLLLLVAGGEAIRQLILALEG